MREHTPGPWEVGAHPSEDIYQVYAPEQPPTSRTIADVYEGADADLIATAPDLLAACEQAIWLLDNMESEGRTSVLLRRVIAQAKGQ